jgi:hypothetical protein
MGKSILHQIPNDKFAEVVAQSTTYIDVMRKLGYADSHDRVAKTVRRRIILQGLDISHFTANFRRKPPEHNLPAHPKSAWVEMIPEEKFIEVAAQVKNFSQFCRAFGKKTCRNYNDRIEARAKLLGINLDHLQYIRGGGTKKTSALLSRQASSSTRNLVKRRLIDEGFLKNECGRCGQGPVWQGQRLSLILHRKSEEQSELTRDNLELLCPNCNQQADAKRRQATARMATKIRTEKMRQQRYLRLLNGG